MQALQIQHRAAELIDARSNATPLTDIVTSSQIPIASRIRALQWLAELLPKLTGVSKTPLPSEHNSLSATEEEEKQGNMKEARSIGLSESGGVEKDFQQLSLSEGRIASAPPQSGPTELDDEIAAALLAAAVAKESDLRLVAVETLQRLIDLGECMPRKEAVATMIAISSERLSDVDTRVQSAWRHLLPQLILHAEVSDQSIAAPLRTRPIDCVDGICTGAHIA